MFETLLPLVFSCHSVHLICTTKVKEQTKREKTLVSVRKRAGASGSEKDARRGKNKTKRQLRERRKKSDIFVVLHIASRHEPSQEKAPD